MSTDALQVSGLSVQVRGHRLLHEVSLRVAAGGFVALVGPNGAGKTTLLRALLGLLPYTGSALVDGREARDLRSRERAARLAWLPQQALATEPLNVLEFVQSARFRFSETRASALAGAESALELAGAGEFAGRVVTTLSGGEQQRVAVAALLAQEAPLLLLDEPANHLDPGQQALMYGMFGRLWREGRGVLCVTHDVNLLAHVGGDPKVIGLADGQIKFESTYRADDLGKHLEGLFGVPFATIKTNGDRALLPNATGVEVHH